MATGTIDNGFYSFNQIYRGEQGETKTTMINVNAGNYGRTILAICSSQFSDGSQTRSAVIMLRCGNSGNFIDRVDIASSPTTESGRFVFNVDPNGYLTCQSSLGRWTILFIMTKN